MNGRVYDYNLGRFMSVDPFVHEGSQGLNPYSYIMNNPLSGTDPTGYSPEEVEKPKKVTITGSRLKRDASSISVLGNKITTGAGNLSFNGTVTTYSKGNGATSSQGAQSDAGTETMDINSQQNVSSENRGSSVQSSSEEKGFYGKPLTRIPSTLYIPEGEEIVDRIEDEVIDSWDLDLIIGKNWRPESTLSAELPDVRDALSGHPVVGGRTVRGGSPISLGVEMHVDIHDYNVKIEMFRRVRVRGRIETFRTLNKALDQSGKPLTPFYGKNYIKDSTTRLPLPGTYIRYRTNTGQKLGTQKWPVPYASKSLR